MSKLYTHTKHPHTPRNVNTPEKGAPPATFNTRLAVFLTQQVGSMRMAYAFAGIGIGSLIGVFTGNVFLAALFGSFSSYFLQLVLLPILSVGQNVIGEKQSGLAEEQFK